jgi:tetratricopeptide (TPR) repeat protein
LIIQQWLQHGFKLQREERLVEAEDCYRIVLKLQNDNIDAMRLLGAIRFRQGRGEEALDYLRRVLKADASLAPAHADMGHILAKLGRNALALRCYRRALVLNASEARYLCDTAAVLSKLRRHAEALDFADQAIALRADYADAHYNRGKALHDLKRLDDALAAYDRALELAPNAIETLNNRGLVLVALHRAEDGLESYNQALKLRPLYPEALNNRGVALNDLRRFEAALLSFDLALKLKPNFAEAHANRGFALNELKRYREALASSNRALKLRPKFYEAWASRGIILKNLNRFDKAIAAFDRAIKLRPRLPMSYGNRAIALKDVKRIEEAKISLKFGLLLAPGAVELLFGESLILLLNGELPLGWIGYETRFEQPRSTPPKLVADYPVWRGEDISGKRIVVFVEQGYGDIIQFSRYLPLLAERGADVTFYASSQLLRILRPLASSARLTADLGDETFDYQCALISLPLAFGTDLDTIPATVPYLQSEPELVSTWAERIGPDGFRIGIAWQGNPTGAVDHGRSFPVSALAPIAAVPGVRLISLQKVFGLEQLANLPPSMRVEVLDPEHDPGPDAFIDTAAIAATLDLVITSDTSLAHLVGALGRPVWVALKYVPDWRWLLDRDDSPWYPTMRLYRQDAPGDWRSVFRKMAGDLRRLVRASRQKRRSVRRRTTQPSGLVD